MARKASKNSAQAASPLSGLTIAVSGTFQGITQAGIQSRIEGLGGAYTKSVTAETTHLISTLKDFEKNSTKVKSAAAASIPIVSLDWIDECESSGSKVDEKMYLLASGTQNTALSQPTSHIQPQSNVASTIKRSASPSPQTSGPSAKRKRGSDSKATAARVGDGKKTKSADIQVPLDEHCPLSTHRVYISSDGTIYDASLNQTNASNNNNKFYIIQLLCDASGSDYKTWTRWGRIGEHGQSAMLGSGSLDDALWHFEKKFKDKSGLKWENRADNPRAGKYTFVEKSYSPDSDDEEDVADGHEDTQENDNKQPPVECTLDPPIRQLMELIFNQQYFAQTMTALNYDANKLPLGKLSKGTINRGFQTLKDLSALMDDPSIAPSEHGMTAPQAMEMLSNRYYSLIPHDFGRNRPPVIQNSVLLKREVELLENLGDMKEAAAMLKSSIKDTSGVHPLDRQFQSLGMEEMQPLDHNSTEFAELTAYLTESKGDTHNLSYRVQDIFRIQRQYEFERFDNSPYAKIASDRRLLWHGSRATNFGGILGQGLRIAPPEAPATGYMFDKGIYLADMSSKSANYCYSHLTGGTALLLLCEAELGAPMQELTQAACDASYTAKAQGMHSTWGKGTTGPQLWKDASCVHPSLAGTKMPDVSVKPGPTGVNGASLYYNEYICYDIAQVKLRYLFRIQM